VATHARQSDPLSAAARKDKDYTVLSTIHSANGQEMANRSDLERGRRMHPVRPRDQHVRGNRGRASAPLRSDDPSQGRARPHRAASFFTHQQAKLGDRHVYATRCRFIPESILDSFASRSWWDHTDSQIEARKKARSSVDVAASLIWMWR
jgi:DNA helicase-2/ATP-dependent DNA helicase PcrA